jgi:PhzF family phenazine biosynthesis protein
MTLPIFTVDAFTAAPFGGNPAGVCLLDAPADPAWMQSVAREMNLSETAFLLPQPDGFDLRWFTPAVEVDLCGHATLASAHILYSSGRLPLAEQARFHTRSGLLTARMVAGWIELDFPSKPVQPAGDLPDLASALGATPTFTGRNQFDYLVELESEQQVRELDPDIAAIKALPARGVIVTARASTPGFDFVSRFFAPAVGVPEDPVTGSAHCCLAPYWSAKLGKNELDAYQASERGGMLRLALNGERVRISGQAVTVMRGEIL